MPNDIIAEITSAGEIVVEISGMTYGSVEAQLALVNADITALETGKADKSDTYTKTEVDDKDALKADKTYTDTELAKKADKATTYTKTETDTAIATKSDTLMATNLVTNGDFSQGTTGWTYYAGGLTVNHSIVDSYCRFNQGTTIDALAKDLSCFLGRKYYITLKAKADSALTIQTGFAQSGVATNLSSPLSVGTVDTNISALITTTQNLTQFIIGRSSTTATNIYVDNILVIDLTATFGAGNEPTKDQMDRLLAEFPNSWFDGTQEILPLKTVNELLNEKANKAQEAWITPTLLNGWTNISGFSTRYKKDGLGVVWVELHIVNGTASSIIFTLPSGYRPVNQPLYINGYLGAVCTVSVEGNVAHQVGIGANVNNRFIFQFRTN